MTLEELEAQVAELSARLDATIAREDKRSAKQWKAIGDAQAADVAINDRLAGVETSVATLASNAVDEMADRIAGDQQTTDMTNAIAVELERVRGVGQITRDETARLAGDLAILAERQAFDAAATDEALAGISDALAVITERLDAVEAGTIAPPIAPPVASVLRDPIARPGPSTHSWVTNPLPVDAHYERILLDGTPVPVNGENSSNAHQDNKAEEVLRPNLTTWRNPGTDRMLYSSVGWGHGITPAIVFPNPGRWTPPHFTGQPIKGTQPAHSGELWPAFDFPDGFTTDARTGTKPNHAGSFIGPDGRIYTTQPIEARLNGGRVEMCSMNVPDRGWGTETVMDHGGGETGEGGNQGGSGMDTTGACIHVGQLVPGGVIDNVIGVTVGTDVICSPARGYVWPAGRADSGWQSNYGTRAPGGAGNVNPAMGMGALLAVPPAEFATLEKAIETAAGMILAVQARDFGRVIVDGDGGITYSTWLICTEWSDRGRTIDEFRQVWGFDFFDKARTAAGDPFRRDCRRIIQALKVVTNNTYDRMHDVALPRIRPWTAELMPLAQAG